MDVYLFILLALCPLGYALCFLVLFYQWRREKRPHQQPDPPAEHVTEPIAQIPVMTVDEDILQSLYDNKMLDTNQVQAIRNSHMVPTMRVQAMTRPLRNKSNE